MSPHASNLDIVSRPPHGRPSETISNAIDPMEVARILRRHIRLVALTVIIVVLAATSYILSVTPLYTSTTSVLIDPRRAEVVDS